ncbi:hypothetical protein L6R46_11625 [Myxococcota bacterium]|nr:hypothetical protein [Myxococcota bacterium]
MKTVLRMPAALTAVSVLAEVAIWERRPELQRLCQAALTAGALSEAVIDASLPGLSASAHRNLLRTVEYLRLTDTKGVVSELGRRCASSGEAPAWELGVFTFLIARPQGFGAWPVAFVREGTDGRDLNFGSLEDAPAWLSPSPGRVWESGFEDHTRFTISAFPTSPGQGPAVRTRSLPPVSLVWELDLLSGKNALHVEGTVEGSGRLRTADMAVPAAEVAAFFPAWERRWSASAGRLLMAYDGAAAKDGRDPFVRALTYKNIKAGAWGTFESAEVEDVPVGPSGAAEAQAWALALALARAKSSDMLIAPSAWRRGWEHLIKDSPLHPHAGAAPDPYKVLDQAMSISPRLGWLLAAPADLSLE